MFDVHALIHKLGKRLREAHVVVDTLLGVDAVTSSGVIDETFRLIERVERLAEQVSMTRNHILRTFPTAPLTIGMEESTRLCEFVSTLITHEKHVYDVACDVHMTIETSLGYTLPWDGHIDVLLKQLATLILDKKIVHT